MIEPFEGRVPHLDPTVWVADGAIVVGDVTIGRDASLWFHAVVRGDIEAVRLGSRTNVQDHVTIHVTGGRYETDVGSAVTIGHGAIVHGCTIGDGTLIGMGAIVMDGAVVGQQALIAAGSLVPPGAVIPPRTLAVGRPARPTRPLTDDELAELAASADRYVDLALRYRANAAR